MDLHLGNIMVHQGRLSGIVDWEFSGWYTPTLDAFSALLNAVDYRECLALYTAAWPIDADLVQAARSTSHVLQRGLTQREKEELPPEIPIGKVLRARRLARKAAREAARKAASRKL